uniref:RING-type domain-containing protein n=1 Tax=Panagrolaimus sp. PS1159 TaxID=55785 RepID=A0AC35GGB9_9BILA
MSYSQNGGFFNNTQKPLPRSTSVKKIDIPDDHKLKKLARCCICFENYSLTTRAPICGPCGHSFCTVCIRTLIYGNLFCCCCCRKVTLFGPKELGKNIQLLDILEHLGLLDPDERVVIQYASSSNFPENVIEAVDGKDLHFDYLLLLDRVSPYEELSEQMGYNANQMLFACHRLSNSLDKAIASFNECLQTINSHTIDHGDDEILDFSYGGIVSRSIPFMESGNYDYPIVLESATIHRLMALDPNHEVDNVSDSDETETSSYNNATFTINPSNEYDTGNDDVIFNEEHEEYEDPPFQPGAWNPVSKLFTQFRSQNNNRNN